MVYTVRKVRLPGGFVVKEVEELHVGGSETQAVYTYYSWAVEGVLFDKSYFKLDYWGRIEGVEVLD